jgi:hypothetical protein
VTSSCPPTATSSGETAAALAGAVSEMLEATRTFAAMKIRFCDEFEGSVGWMRAKPEFWRRTSHAVASDGRVWIVDALDGDGLDERVRALGEPAGVVQLLDRHSRDCRAVAERFQVPLHVTPFTGVAEAPFEVVRIADVPGWREVAVWFPAERVLVCGDAIGTAGYFPAPGQLAGVHPLLRLTPPRALAHFEPRQLLVGHGRGLAGDEASEALATALRTARRRIPSWLVALPQSRRRHQ